MGRKQRREWILSHSVLAVLGFAVIFAVILVIIRQINEPDPFSVPAALFAFTFGLIIGSGFVARLRRSVLREQGVIPPSRRDLRREQERRERRADW